MRLRRKPGSRPPNCRSGIAGTGSRARNASGAGSPSWKTNSPALSGLTEEVEGRLDGAIGEIRAAAGEVEAMRNAAGQCDGERPRLHHRLRRRRGRPSASELAAHVDAKAREVLGSVGQVGDARLLLMAALLIADEHHDCASWPPRLRRSQARQSLQRVRNRRSKAATRWKCAAAEDMPRDEAGASRPRRRRMEQRGVSRGLEQIIAADASSPARLELGYARTDTASRVRLAMPRGLNGTHRELSLAGAVASDIWRPPALQAREDPNTNGECGSVHL